MEGEESDCKRKPSLPPNYVTLVQLQERWVKEQQRKQREKEEEEERKHREKEEEQRKSEVQEHQKNKQYEDGARRKRNSSYRCRPHENGERVKAISTNRRPPEQRISRVSRSKVSEGSPDSVGAKFQKNRQSQSEQSFRRIGMSKPQTEVSRVGEIEIDEQKIGDLLKKKKKRKKKKNRYPGMKGKSSAEEDLTGSTEPALPALPEFETLTGIEGDNEDSQVGEIEIDKQKIDDLKKKRYRWKKGKPREDEDLAGSTEPDLPALLELETMGKKIPVVLTGINGDNKGAVSEFQRKGKYLVVNDRVWEKKVPVDRSAEIGRKFGDLSLNARKGGKQRNTIAINMHEGRWNYSSRSAGMFNRQRLQKPMDSNLVWVRKGDASDVNVAGVSS